MAVQVAGLLDLWQPLTLFKVAETPSVELTLRLPRLLVHLCHDALDQVQLKKETKVLHCMNAFHVSFFVMKKVSHPLHLRSRRAEIKIVAWVLNRKSRCMFKKNVE